MKRSCLISSILRTYLQNILWEISYQNSYKQLLYLHLVWKIYHIENNINSNPKRTKNR